MLFVVFYITESSRLYLSLLIRTNSETRVPEDTYGPDKNFREITLLTQMAFTRSAALRPLVRQYLSSISSIESVIYSRGNNTQAKQIQLSSNNPTQTLRLYSTGNTTTKRTSIMNAVEFYFMPESPPCRAVEMVANMVGVVLNKHYVDLFSGDQMKDEYVKMNPQHKVPFIVDGNLKLGESRAIMAYLVSRYKSGDPLYPNDPVQRAGIDEILYFDAATLHPSGTRLFRPILFGGKKELDSDADKAYRENLQVLETILTNNGGGKFLFGDHLTIADISLCSHLSFVHAFDYDLSMYKNLTAYYGRVKESIPDYGKINNEAEDNLKKFIKSKLES